MKAEEMEWGPDLGPIEFWYIGWANTLDSARTQEGTDNAKGGLTTVSDIRVLHAAMGLVTEAAEIMDSVKKKVFYQKSLDRDNLMEELGDILWYVALAAKELGHETLTPIMEANYRKLSTRYGKAWSRDGALTRDVALEMQAVTSATTCPICTHKTHDGGMCFDAHCLCRGRT